MADPGFVAQGVTCSLGGARILEGVDIAVGAGELVVLIGPNGAGKSTLLKGLAGLVRTAGDIAIGGVAAAAMSPRERALRMGYLEQGHTVHWPLGVREVVAIGRLPHMRGADLGVEDRRAVAAAMEAAGISGLADRVVTTLSGGERARVALARVLATGAPILLADEPTTSLDLRYQLTVANLLRQRARDGGAVLAVLHDLTLAARFADRIVVLADGRIHADGGPRDVLTEAMLREVFHVEARIADIDGVPVAVPVEAA